MTIRYRFGLKPKSIAHVMPIYIAWNGFMDSLKETIEIRMLQRILAASLEEAQNYNARCRRLSQVEKKNLCG